MKERISEHRILQLNDRVPPSCYSGHLTSVELGMTSFLGNVPGDHAKAVIHFANKNLERSFLRPRRARKPPFLKVFCVAKTKRQYSAHAMKTRLFFF